MTPKMALMSIQAIFITVLALTGLCPVVSAQNNLITISRQKRSLRSKAVVCCSDKNLKTCDLANINIKLLGKGTIRLPGGIEVDFLNTVGDNPNSYHYGRNATDVIITFNPSTGGMHGHAMTSDGRSFTIENCGTEGHVWKEISVDLLGDNESVDFVDSQQRGRNSHDALLTQAFTDTTSMVTYSVKFYYTPDFAATTPDIPGFIDEVVAETNQGYINSQVPLQISVHCIEQASINDVSNAGTMLYNFKDMKSSVEELRGSADAAALLVNSFGACGIAFLNTIGSGSTVSVTAKGCAVGYYSFGHEVGHNIGLHHDPDTSTNSAYPYGHGHLIAQGSASKGYRTILAYSAPNHGIRVNHYSNPNVIYSETGTPTGVVGISNNARLLLENRMSFAAVGDESETCGNQVAKQCPRGFKPFGTKCYRITWGQYTGTDIIKACKKENANAIPGKIESEEELAFVHSIRHNDLWINGNDSHTEGVWRYHDGTPIEFLKWKGGEPSDKGRKKENCLRLMAQGFNDEKCYAPIWTLCTVEQYKAAYPKECPKGWTQYKTKCFKTIHENPATYGDNMKDCRYKQAGFIPVLAVIENQEELDFVQTLYSFERMWIDGEWDAKTGTWRLNHDKSPRPFFNWNAEQPDNAKGDENCLMIENGKFSDVKCQNTGLNIGAICTIYLD